MLRCASGTIGSAAAIAARLTLKITDVRVQRLHDISKEECYAEGIPHDEQAPKIAFMNLWDWLHPGEPANPWVWAITFEVIAQNVDAYIATRAMRGPRDPRPTEHFIGKEPTGA